LLTYGIQTKGSEQWEKSFNYPRYGLGLYTLLSGSPDIFGNAYAVFTFLNFDFFRINKLSFFYEFAPGINYSPTHYDALTNNRNDIISTDINFFVNMRLAFAYRFNRITFILGGNFTHFSNGATNMPNKGLNMYGLSTSLKYNFYNYDDIKFIETPKKYIHNKNNYSLFFASGYKERLIDGEYNSKKFVIYTLSASYGRLYSKISEVGLGLDLFFDSSLEYDKEFKDKSRSEYLQYGFHISHLFHLNKIGLLTDLGIYLKNRDIKGPLWSRLGLRYNFIKNIFTQISLKTQYGAKADFIEWSLGFNI
jgi:hypothetical protein